MTESNWVYLNGSVLEAKDAYISPFDRGVLFGHAAYEVTAVYGGKLVDFAGHAERLARTLTALDIPNPHDGDGWHHIHETLISRNALDEGLVYLQVTAGAYGNRDFAGPDTFTPGIFMFTAPRPLIGPPARDGIAAITQPDTRWARRDLKTTQLVSQALAYRAARAAGATTAILHEDGVVTEAASANVWIVTADGTLVTRDLSPAILPGITRTAVIRQLSALQVEVSERAFDLSALRNAAEVFTTSAGALIAPIITLDGAPVGSGRPGPVTRRVQAAYYAAMGADTARIDWL